jgi:hypothetical protein
MDYYTKVGKHLVNQDYCLLDKDIGIISDGCSTLANTDVGARILSHAFLKEKDIFQALDTALEQAMNMKISYQCLHATLGCIIDSEEISIKLWGDGVIVWCYEKPFIVPVSQSRPFYPIYYKLYDDFQLLQAYNMKYERYDPQYTITLPKKGLQYALLFTDGIQSCITDYIKILDEITQFKNLNGQFLQRRMNTVMKSYSNYDDLSVIGWSNDGLSSY